MSGTLLDRLSPIIFRIKSLFCQKVFNPSQLSAKRALLSVHTKSFHQLHYTLRADSHCEGIGICIGTDRHWKHKPLLCLRGMQTHSRTKRNGTPPSPLGLNHAWQKHLIYSHILLHSQCLAHYRSAFLSMSMDGLHLVSPSISRCHD